MGIFPAGFAIALLLFWSGARLGSGPFIGLLASLPFGATAFAAVGGSTPLIFTLFEALCLWALISARLPLALVLKEWTGWVILGLAVYVLGGAILLPRIFAGDIIVPGYTTDGNMFAQPLSPVFGNFTQAGYFALACSTYFAFRALLTTERGFTILARGFFVFAFVHAMLGSIDLLGKMVGLSDSLAPIRTAAYVIRTSDTVAGMWRISGGFSEASGFALAGTAAIAFCFSFWRQTGDRTALVLTVWLGLLLLLSTSTAAYVALVILVIPVGVSVLRSAAFDDLNARDLTLCGLACTAGLALAGAFVFMPHKLTPAMMLVEESILNKSVSHSGIERGYWNTMSLQAFAQSSGLGIGIGTSRASSWSIAVAGQLGVPGIAVFLLLTGTLLRGLSGLGSDIRSEIPGTIAQSVRGAGMASILTASLIGGSADPGVLFYIALAAVMACRAEAPAFRALERTGVSA